MFSDRISDYFEGIAAKYLKAVDAISDASNQHEFGGLPTAGFKKYLGTPGKGENEKFFFPAHLVYIDDDDGQLTACDDLLSWYDARRKNPKRSPEYRLYYPTNPVTSRMKEGDFLLVGKRTDGSLLLVICPPGSSVEAQLRAVFGLNALYDEFTKGEIEQTALILPVRLLLEDLGLVTAESLIERADWLDRLIASFGGHNFPLTSVFSAFARESLQGELDPVADPDATLMGWMEHEELLFRTYERYIVQQRLRQGFGADGADVDEFISYSLSVQNRRKSRVGHAFEGHLEALFLANKLQFERSRGKGKVTENNSRPDFMFPGFAHYHDHTFPTEKLVVLGAKTTCKDRWRQVLAEANRIEQKHLITLEPAISVAQTEEMASARLQLVVPLTVQSTYAEQQRHQLQDVRGFIQQVARMEAAGRNPGAR